MIDLKAKNGLANQIENKIKMEEQKKQMKAFDSKLDNLADQIELTVQKHGQDYFMVDILTMFLDVSIKLKEVMDMMHSMDMVMELIGDATNFIDQSMQLQNDIMESTMKEKYTIWTRITTYFKTRAIIRNNVNRVSSMANSILTKYKMATSMVTALQGVSGQLRRMTTKMNRANNKKKKTDSYSSGAAQYTDAQKYLQDRKAAKGEAAAPSAAPSGSMSSAPASGGSSSGGLDLSGI